MTKLEKWIDDLVEYRVVEGESIKAILEEYSKEEILEQLQEEISENFHSFYLNEENIDSLIELLTLLKVGLSLE